MYFLLFWPTVDVGNVVGRLSNRKPTSGTTRMCEGERWWISRRENAPVAENSRKTTLLVIGRSVWRQLEVKKRGRVEAQESTRGRERRVSAARRWPLQTIPGTNAKRALTGEEGPYRGSSSFKVQGLFPSDF